jgi:DNA-binding transcriptional ArsR family regulator
MTQTHFLFSHEMPEHGRARCADPDTSKAAAKSITANALEAIVLCALQRRPDGLTTHELADLTGLSLVSISPRMAPLRKKNLVRDSGERRLTSTGSKAIVWKII